jgi:hypothetical protein
MSSLPAAILFALSIAAAGCSDARRNALAKVREIGPERLRTEAALTYKNLFAGPGSGLFALKENQWPTSFARLEPEHVVAYPNGFSIALTRDGVTEAGVFVVPLHMEQRPSSSSRATFEQLAEGIFWYSFHGRLAPEACE